MKIEQAAFFRDLAANCWSMGNRSRARPMFSYPNTGA
jgi:hypothetical protein